MKVLMQPIEMIAWFTEKGSIHPFKFRMKNTDESYIVVKVDKVLHQREEKLIGNKMIVYTCQSIVDSMEKLYELKYEIKTCKWFLYKI